MAALAYRVRRGMGGEAIDCAAFADVALEDVDRIKVARPVGGG